MKVLLAEHLGLCFGVRRAISLAERCLKHGPAYSLGDLIHNPPEMQRLRSLGLKSLGDITEAHGGTVLLRTHGSPPEYYDLAKQRGIRLADATCPHVRAAQRAAARLARQGYTVVVVGDPNHPEVRSVVEWARGSAVVIRGALDASSLRGDRFGVISQTTEQAETVREVVQACKLKGEVTVIDTVCNATALRQKAVRDLAQNVNVLIVVGGHNSANTRQLAVCAAREGARTYLVECAAEIEASWLRGESWVGVAAGASTPDWIIKEVVDLLEEMEKQPVLKSAEEQEEAEAQKPSSEVAHEPAPDQTPQAVPDQVSQASEHLEHEPPKVGDIVDAIVVSVDETGAMVDIGYKAEGFIDRKEIGKRPDAVPSEVVKPGDTIKAMVLTLESAEGAAKLSKRRADEVLAWARLREVMEAGEAIEAPVVQQVKGGLVVDVGLRGFVPASQVEMGFVSDLARYVGQTMSLKIIELDKSKNRVILSRRAVLEQEAEAKKAQAWERIREGEELTGIVKSLTDFGAFVDLGGVDGLLHVSELSWGRVKHASDVLTIGQQIPVKVLRIDQEKGRISLGYKQTQPDPWSKAGASYPVGATVKGTVTRVAPFGAFVELEPGIEGLIHISELSNQRVAKAEEVVSPGQEITARVLQSKPAERRISLSMRQADERPPKPARMAKPQTEQTQPDKLTIGDVLGNKLQEALHGKKPERE